MLHKAGKVVILCILVIEIAQIGVVKDLFGKTVGGVQKTVVI